MFDFLRAVFRSTADKEQEQLSAYLDNALSPVERRQFEQKLQDNAELQAALTSLRLLKANLRQLPRHRAPRSFALSAAVHGRRRPQMAVQLYPMLRAATVLSAFFLVLAVVMSLLTPGDQQAATMADSAVELESLALMEAAEPAEPRALAVPEAATAEAEEEMVAGLMAVDVEEGVMVAAESDVEPKVEETEAAAVRRPAAPETGAAPVEEPVGEMPTGGVDSEAAPPIAAELTAAPLPLVTPTIYAPLIVEPTPMPMPLVITPPARIPWQIIQTVFGASFLVLLAVTLYLRRRLL
jgi:anti-sigma factor RsiW